MIKENNTTMTTTIQDSVNEALKEFQITVVKTCEDMIAKQMSTIKINMINTITATLAEQQLNQQRLTWNHIQQNETNQPSNNLLQQILPSPPNTQPPQNHHIEGGITATGSNKQIKQPTAKRKQTDPLESDEIIDTPDETSH